MAIETMINQWIQGYHILRSTPIAEMASAFGGGASISTLIRGVICVPILNHLLKLWVRGIYMIEL